MAHKAVLENWKNCKNYQSLDKMWKNFITFKKELKQILKNSRYLVYFCWGLHLWPLLTLAARLRASSNENIPSKAVPPQNNTWNPISIKGTFQNYFFRQKSLFPFYCFCMACVPKGTTLKWYLLSCLYFLFVASRYQHDITHKIKI